MKDPGTNGPRAAYNELYELDLPRFNPGSKEDLDVAKTGEPREKTFFEWALGLDPPAGKAEGVEGHDEAEAEERPAEPAPAAAPRRTDGKLRRAVDELRTEVRDGIAALGKRLDGSAGAGGKRDAQGGVAGGSGSQPGASGASEKPAGDGGKPPAA